MIIRSLNNYCPPVLPNAIRIIQPKSSADIEQWLKIVNSELLAPSQMDKALLESLIFQPDFEIYLLKYNEVGVSTILVFQTADSIGLYLIATKKSAQKQGFASLLVQHFLTGKAQRLKKPVVLHATQKGEKLYSKLGFRPVNQFFLYQHLKTNL
jgi:GNAT superfamily N-acetyltransferase